MSAMKRAFKLYSHFNTKRFYASIKRQRSPFEILKLKESASTSEIKQRYKEIAKELHPDRKDTGNLAKFQELVQAYEILIDPHKRAYYLRTGQCWEVKSSNSPPPGRRPSSYTNAYWAEPPSNGTTSTYTKYSNVTFISLLAGAVITVVTFNFFYLHASHTSLSSAADRQHLKSSQDLKRARTEAQLFGNDRGINRVMDNRMKSFRKEEQLQVANASKEP